MYIIIAGGGIVGMSITKILSKNHDVVVIEKDYDKCETISAKYGAIAVNGDATNLNTLKEAGIGKCDYALGVMREDPSNLLFALLCNNFGVENIFVRMRDPEYRTAYVLAGATNIGHAVEMMVNKFILDIENPEIRRVVSLSNGKAEVCIVTLKENVKATGMKIMDLSRSKGFPLDVVIAGIFDLEKDEFIIPRGSTVIPPGSQIFLVGPSKAIERAHQFLLR
jgi:trk system potassium uptake protein TrkA